MAKAKARKSKMPEEVDLDITVKAYCVKCKAKNTKITDPFLTWTWLSNQSKWKPMVQGVHSKCGTKMTKFVSQQFVDDLDI